MFKLMMVLLCVVLSGCASPAAVRKAAFDEKEYEPFASKGTGAIDAQAFLRTENGRVVTAAGSKIYCEPVTQYSAEYYVRSVLGGEKIASWDERALKYIHAKIGDADGRARFTELPAGEYFVYSHITWKAYDSNKYVGVYDYDTGGVAYTTVKVNDGQVTEAVATR